MNRAISSSRLLLACALPVLLLSACAFNQPEGSAFSPRALSRPDRALVYVYRPTGEKFGWDRAYSLLANGAVVTDLLYEGYFPLEVEPGKLSLAADLKKTMGQELRVGLLEYSLRPDAAKLELETKAGDTYFVKFHPEAHAFSFEPRLYLVAAAVGEREISACQLVTNEE
jgi:hypothetical protein